ncbi:transcription termination factor 2, mitochondrial [Pseudophryne corroboree]|uniref:transcription termination factor 2, mitochondrial n=1 Tax=Pseudophryne corroboree TaxID=495146 RepID=UPI0030816043
MSKIIFDTVLKWRMGPGRKVFPYKNIFLCIGLAGTRKYTSVHSGPDTQHSGEENKRTVDNLYKLSVNINKIRQLKGWVLHKDVAYVEETANILKEMGASELTVACILESCPEAFLQEPSEINTQKSIWNLVCPRDGDIVTIIKKFPDSFFAYKSPKNQQDNINYFQDLGLRNKIVCRLLTSAPQIFCSPVEDNKKMINSLQESYLSLGGAEENFKTWLLKLLSQDPFVLSKSPQAMKENLKFLQNLGFHDTEVLKLLSKLKGFIFDLTRGTMEKGVSFTKATFQCSQEELRHMIIKCPALLYYPVPVLEERLKHLLREGVSIFQIKECLNVLELTPQIIEFRVKKIKQLGHEMKDQNLDVINGNKNYFEANYVKLQVRKERPLFNPVAPLHVDE